MNKYMKKIFVIMILLILLLILTGCNSLNDVTNNFVNSNISQNKLVNNTLNTTINNSISSNNTSAINTDTINNTSTSSVSNLKLEPLSLKVGKAYVIKADKETIFNFSKKDWLEFRKLYLDTHKGDNWLTIYFGDKMGIIFAGMDFIGTLCSIDPNDQYTVASPANDLEYIEIYKDTNEVKFDFPESGNTKNYFVGLEK